MSSEPLPYGTDDLDPRVVVYDGPPKTLQCFVNGCSERLRPPRRSGFNGDVCPIHGIRCHSSGTYSYRDASRNVIIDSGLFSQRIVGHPDKYESGRLGSENSEDTLSWNVFRSLQKAGCLSKVATKLIRVTETDEPTLYLWGLRTSDDCFDQWDLLRKARIRFESNLPVERPLTEPDIALYLPGRYLVLIEAKFTSTNPFYSSGPRINAMSLSLDELRTIYHDRSLRLLDHKKALTRDRIHYQLWRNTIFAEWMAQQDSTNTKAYHVNLVRSGHDEASAAEFHELISDESKDYFRRITWEDIYGVVDDGLSGMDRLRDYMQKKTASLTKALNV